jgi:putative membrane protein
VTLPKTLSQKDKTVRDRLGKLSGSAFDQRYMSDMVTDHVQDIADFTREANQGHDSDVKDFASKTLPTLKMHLTMARDVRDGKGMPAEGSGTSTGSGQ